MDKSDFLYLCLVIALVTFFGYFIIASPIGKYKCQDFCESKNMNISWENKVNTRDGFCKEYKGDTMIKHPIDYEGEVCYFVEVNP